MATRPDLAVIVPSLDIGGTERHLLAVLPQVNAAGISVRVYVLSGSGALCDDMQRAGIVVDGAPAGANLLTQLVGLWRWLRARQPRIVHFFLPKAYLLGTLCLPRGMRAIMSRRSLNRYQQRRPLARQLERYCHRRLDLALANSQAIADELKSEGITADITRVIYNGVELQPHVNAAARAAARQDLDLEPDATVFLCVANLFEYKGHADVIEALSLLQHPLPPH